MDDIERIIEKNKEIQSLRSKYAISLCGVIFFLSTFSIYIFLQKLYESFIIGFVILIGFAVTYASDISKGKFKIKRK